jgi:predicted aspartyl protease
MKFPYNRDYSPIAPSLQVTFVSAEKQFSVGPFIALVDTGTDATAVPIAHLEKIMAPIARESMVVPHWGARYAVSLFSVDVKIGEWTFAGIEVIGDTRGNEVILGRDVLNKLRLLLDGPAQTTEILEPKSKRK